MAESDIDQMQAFCPQPTSGFDIIKKNARGQNNSRLPVELAITMTMAFPKLILLAFTAIISLAAALPRAVTYNSTSGQPDYVIIGGGPAGYVLAEELSKGTNKTVVLLEAGPDTAGVHNVDIPGYGPFLLGTQYTWNYTSQPDASLGGATPTLEQGRGSGGGSAVNYLGACRGAPSVFDQWAEISGDEGLRWENFLEDYKKTVHFTNQPLEYDPHVNMSAYGDGPLELTAPSTTIGGFLLQFIGSLMSTLNLPRVDLNDGHGIGVTSGTDTIRASNRTRDYAPQAYGWQLAGRKNAQQLYNAEVTKIGFEGKRATSVTYVDPTSNATNTLRPKEIILAAGALNSPKLLMLSGVGPANHLASLNIPVVADVPELGRNLRDHHCAYMEFEVTQEVQTIWQYTQNATFEAIATQEYRGNNGAGPLGVPPGAAFATYRAPDSVFESVNDHFHTSLPADRGQLLFQYATSTFQATTPNVSIVSPFVGLVQPEGSGYMLLASNDYHDKPLIYSNYYGSNGDKAAILHGYKRMREVFSSPQLAPILVRELYPGANVTSDADLMHAIAGASLSFHHPMGTVSLGTVVEGKTWRINGLEGIRVVDSSTFPYPPTCHPMATTYAYGYHAAQLIREQDF